MTMYYMKKILFAGVMGIALTGGAHADWFQDMADRVVQQNNPKRLAAIARCIEAEDRALSHGDISGRVSAQREADIKTAYEICILQAKNMYPNPGE